MKKLKQFHPKWMVTIGVGLITTLSLGLGMGMARWTDQRHSASGEQLSPDGSADSGSSLPRASVAQTIPSSLVFPLATLPPEERMKELEAIAQGTHAQQKKAATLDPSRARFLLASDALTLGQPQDALGHLDALEASYPEMEVAILSHRAQAYDALGDADAAQVTWQQLLQTHPDHPFAAEALYALGSDDDQFWTQAIERFPSHPRTVEIVQAKLKENPNQPNLLLILARYAPYHPDIVTVLNRLTENHSDQLQLDDWEAIGFAYWEKWQYGKAGRAYAKVPTTPQNAYRAGRGAHLGGRTQEAIAHYRAAVQRFPEAEDSSQALLHLSRLVGATKALPYLDQLSETFPERGDEVLLARARVLDKLNSPVSAKQARKSILTQYSASDTAADLRWEKAQAAAEQGQWTEAWKWAGQVVQENPDSEWAPEAAFWVGKWAKKLGKAREATRAFNYVLRRYPESYYAWRSAVQLGWDVGDFHTVRRQSPALQQQRRRTPLPRGSAMVQELYLLGQDYDAWSLWQVEFKNAKTPTVAEQFTDGVLKIGVGHYLNGIFLLENLDWRATADGDFTADVAINTATHAYTRYPFPYYDAIRAWAHQRQLNPLLVISLMRQESRFQPAITSVAGAKGLMQVMPATAQWIANQTDIDTYELTNPQDSIKLGTWYLSYTHGEYADNSMFAIASYNAGPGNVASWIDRFGIEDLDTFVTQIPFPETKGYVTSVFENYWNYLRLYNTDISTKLENHRQ